MPPVSPPVLVQSRKTGQGVRLRPMHNVHVCARVGVCMCAAVKPGCTLPTHSTFGRTNSGNETTLDSTTGLGWGAALHPHHPESSLDW